MGLTFHIPIEPLSVNKLYCNIYGQSRRFISKDGKEFKSKVSTLIRDEIVTNNLTINISEFSNKKLWVFFDIGLSSWLLKDGKTIRKKDLDNMSKALQDCLFSVLAEFCTDIDDCQIWELSLRKTVTTSPMTHIIIDVID